MKRKLLWTALALASVSGAAQAVLFDPDGTGPLPVMDIGGIDWGPTTFLAQGGTAAVNAWVTSGGTCTGTPNPCTFTVYTQASVIGFTAPNGTPLANPAGLNSTFEITMVASFTETVFDVHDNTVTTTASFHTSSTPTIVEFYYDNNPATFGVPLTGYGYNDGRFILDGTLITNANGSFAVNDSSLTAPVTLDQTPDGNQYITVAGLNQLTVTGQGDTGNITVGGLTVDPTFFVSPLATLGYTFTNISQNLPFILPNPADCFNGGVNTPAVAIGTNFTSTCDNSHVPGPYSLQTNPGAGAVVPVTGIVNGFPSPSAGGPDFVASTDFNSTLTPRVPEPATLALLGIGLGALGLGSRRRKVRPV